MHYTLLIVDDEALIRRGLSQIIPWDEMGYELVGAVSDAQQALQILERKRVDVLLTDISMPEMNGLELIEKAKEYNPDLKSVIISGYSQFDYAWEAIQLKVENYILKPLDPDKIQDIFIRLKENMEKENRGKRREYEIYPIKELDSNLNLLIQCLEQGSEEEVTIALQTVFSECRTFHSQNIKEYMRVLLEKLIYYFRMEQDVKLEFSLLEVSDVSDDEKERELDAHLEEIFSNDIKTIYQKLKERSEALGVRVSYQARQYIHEHYKDKELSLRQVAEALHVSYGYLSTVFTKTFGENFKSYLVAVRIEKSRELLMEHKYKIYEIADLVGYGSSRYFTDAFKKRYGLSPADYLNKIGQDR